METFDEEVMNTFGKRLRAAREAAGHETAKAFAQTLDVEENRYRHWERGSAQPSLPMLIRICRALRKDPNYFLPKGVMSNGRQAA